MRIDYHPLLPTGQYAPTKTADLYHTFPRSYGRQFPIPLHINRASRTYALSHLTLRFHCYWNLKIDVPYIQAKGCSKSAARFNFAHLAGAGLLDGFRNLALDVEILYGSVNSPDVAASIQQCLDLTNLYLAYPSMGIWDDAEGPDTSKAWSIGPPSESMVSVVSRKATMTKLPEDVLGYLKDDDRVALENLPGRTSKLKIDMITWLSMIEKRDLLFSAVMGWGV
ncbi:hypothetical protein SBOR_4368 [Sclerotinia borealis F-4128]|uniref:Uncharacterized protein n=1 Tax=Sclerotinia borealis (strain F-4128) TaxID=1432307 RepID=W9CHA9_SCLBF|nr:hypothetical protein SBOR_4368 [Sclerotinia borealis F-4128]